MSLLMAMAVAVIPASAADTEARTPVYLKPNSNWKTDSAWFAVYYWNSTGNGWARMVATDSTNNTYVAFIPSGYTSYKYVRMNSSKNTTDWSSKWNESSNLTVPSKGGNNCYSIAGWDNGGGSWSKITTTYKTVYFKNTSNWSNVYCHAWVDNGNRDADVTTWNGLTMTNLGEGIWSCQLPTIVNSVIFNNNSSQTEDLSIKTDNCQLYDFGAKAWSEYHADADKNHVCDVCAKTNLGTHADSNTDKDHVCDYGCGVTLEECYGGTATCTEKAVCTACGEKYGEALGHDWDDATCTAPKTCSVCGATEGEALGHDWNDATCTDPKTCGTCGATEGGPVHATVTHVASKAATCTENGNIEYWYCEACGQAWLDEDCRFNTNLLAVVLPMTNHLENCPHKAVVGGTYYETLQQAIAGATAGSEIVLNSDIEVLGDLTIENQVIINLNGKTLTAGAVVTFYEGTQFIGEGKLVVAKDSLYNIKGETDYVPVWNAPVLGENDEVVTPGYYTFSEVKDQIKESTVEGTEVVVFRPAFENKEIKKEFVDGASDNGLSFVISITWEGLAKPKEYTLTDDFIANVYNAENPKAIQLGFENWQAGVEYTVTLRIVSGGIYYETTLCTMKDGAITVPEIVTE